MVNTTDNKDNIFARSHERISKFTFDKKVADVFDDMIRRSVPIYDAVNLMIGIITKEMPQKGSNYYDLGCSLGETTLVMRRNINLPECKIIAVDNAQAMVKKCRERIENDKSDVPVDVICSDIRDIQIENAHLVVINYTLQFLDPDDRFEIIKRVFDGLKSGGRLIVSEKVAFDDILEETYNTDLYHAFKRHKGYSDLEIFQKRVALENVLIPETIEQHKRRFLNAGFSHARILIQAFNFVSILAYK